MRFGAVFQHPKLFEMTILEQGLAGSDALLAFFVVAEITATSNTMLAREKAGTGAAADCGELQLEV